MIPSLWRVILVYEFTGQNCTCKIFHIFAKDVSIGDLSESYNYCVPTHLIM